MKFSLASAMSPIALRLPTYSDMITPRSRSTSLCEMVSPSARSRSQVNDMSEPVIGDLGEIEAEGGLIRTRSRRSGRGRSRRESAKRFITCRPGVGRAVERHVFEEVGDAALVRLPRLPLAGADHQGMTVTWRVPARRITHRSGPFGSLPISASGWAA